MNEYIKVLSDLLFGMQREGEVRFCDRLGVSVCERDGHAPSLSSPDFSGLLFHFSPLFYYFLLPVNINNENEINRSSEYE